MNKKMTKTRRVVYVFGMTVICFMLGAAPLISMAYANNNKGGGYTGPGAGAVGGYTGPGPAIMTIKKAAEQPDDAWVTLQGKIINYKGDEKYTFQDASGTGTIEIDRKVWRGGNVGAQDTVKLLISVDKDWGATELEVKRIEVVK